MRVDGCLASGEERGWVLRFLWIFLEVSNVAPFCDFFVVVFHYILTPFTSLNIITDILIRSNAHPAQTKVKGHIGHAANERIIFILFPDNLT